MDILEKFRSIEERYEELQSELSKPEVASNPKSLKELGRALSDLTDIVNVGRALQKVNQAILDARSLLEAEEEEIRELAQSELETLEKEAVELNEKMKILLLPKDPDDDRNILFEIRGGTGGDEAAIFAGDLFRMYVRFAELKGWKVEILSEHASEAGGYKEIIFSVEGDRVYSRMKYEGGVHRVQRIPETENQGRIHTSAATVVVMPEAEEIDIDIPENDIRVDRFCSSGPGGQSVNTTYSAVRITHLPTGIVATCQDEKSQIKNREKAMKVLRARLLEKKREEEEAKRGDQRRAMVRSGDRSERIRTYNYPQSRITDHRINFTTHSLREVLDGNLDILIEPLVTEDRLQRMAEL